MKTEYKKNYVMVDIEANGPIPGDYSMTSLGAIVVDEKMDKKFKINIKPISEKSDPNRNQFVDGKDAVDAKEAMEKFKDWLDKNTEKDKKTVFISDNNGFDWMFVCWYFWHFLEENPLGYNSENLSSLYRGLKKDLSLSLKDLRKNELTHDALEDAEENSRLLSEFFKLVE